MEDKEVASAPSTSSTPTDDDDDAITTSTESEAWTLVTDKNKKPSSEQEPTASLKNAEAFQNRVEELQENAHIGGNDDESRDFTADHDSTIDDLSDGISIISESESAGRISPHPFLRQHFNDLNLKFATGDEIDLPAQQAMPQELQSSAVQTVDDDLEIRHRRKRSKSTDSNRELIHTAELDTPARFHPIVRTGLTGLFYVGVLLAVLAFIGKLRYPEWEPLASNKDIVDLEHKLTEMELRNNLMRAEIDILSKQVNYLTNRNDGKGSSSSSQGKRNSRGKSLTDKDSMASNEFDQPIKCSDESVDDISRNCIAPNGKEESVAEPSETPKQFVKKEKFPKNPFNDDEKSNDAQEGESKFRETKAEEKLDKPGQGNNQRRHAPISKEQRESYEKKYNNRREHSKENRHHGNDDDDSRERFNKQRFAKNPNDQNSKERVHKHQKHHKMGENNSKERFEKRNEHHMKLSSAETNDGEWHAKLMKHRESARRNNEKQRKDDKNWYIERGNAREQIRHVDHHYR